MIESVNNKEVIFLSKLRETKTIKENKMYIVETPHLVEEAFKAGLLLKVITSDENLNTYGVPTILMNQKCMEKISALKSVPSIMGLVSLKENKEIKGTKIIILDNVQDPGNVGTIIRSALAFNVDTVVLSNDSVNVFNEKLIRSSEGNIFKMNVVTMDTIEAINKIKNMNIDVYYADMHGKEDVCEIKPASYCLVMGSEGKGISDKVKDNCTKSIRIDMNPSCESLNVAVASSIIMHAFRS